MDGRVVGNSSQLRLGEFLDGASAVEKVRLGAAFSIGNEGSGGG